MSLTAKLTIDDVDFTDKRVLMRVDYNVPLNASGEVTDARRVEATLPSLRRILEGGARSVVLISHLGRPNGVPTPKYSLRPVAALLQRLLNAPVEFVEDCVGAAAEKATAAANGGAVLLLENLRFHAEEEGKRKDAATGQSVKASPEDVKAFRSSLARHGDVFVFDAFAAAHRAHSSVVGVELPTRAAGLLMKKELEYFGRALENPSRPFVAILGGAKVHDKIQLIENLLDRVDEMVIGGGMAYTFKKTVYGIAIGDSLFDQDGAAIVQRIVDLAAAKNVSLHFPSDYITADRFAPDAVVGSASDASGGVPAGLMALDCGVESRTAIAAVIDRAKTLVWNGPLGVFEMDAFANGTREALLRVADATSSGRLTSIVGGGDTAAAAEKFGVADRISHVSTGGGASLELLEGKALPGVEALSPKPPATA